MCPNKRTNVYISWLEVSICQRQKVGSMLGIESTSTHKVEKGPITANYSALWLSGTVPSRLYRLVTQIWSGNATIHKTDKEQITNKRRILDYCIWNASEKDKRWNDTQCFQVIPSNDSRGTAIFIRVLKIDCTSSISITKPLNTIT